jgi:hypothetical protein
MGKFKDLTDHLIAETQPVLGKHWFVLTATSAGELEEELEAKGKEGFMPIGNLVVKENRGKLFYILLLHRN